MKKVKVNKNLMTLTLLTAGLVLSLCGFAWASSDAGASGVHNAWTSSDTYKVLNFALLLAGVIFIIKKFVPQLLQSRAKGIADEIEALEQKKAEAESKLAEYQSKFKNLDQESKQIVEDYIKQGENAKARIIDEAKAQADKLEDLAKRNIEQEFKTAKATLQQEIVEMAMEKAEEVVKASITSKDQTKLVDEYLKKVVA